MFFAILAEIKENFQFSFSKLHLARIFRLIAFFKIIHWIRCSMMNKNNQSIGMNYEHAQSITCRLSWLKKEKKKSLFPKQESVSQPGGGGSRSS